MKIKSSFVENKFFRWGVKGSLSILDQSIYSGANFILIILLARWLDIGSFGAFSVTYSIFSVFYQLHNGFVSEPINVLGPASYFDHVRAYLRSQTVIHFLSTFGVGLLFIIGTCISHIIIQNIDNDHHFVYLGFLVPFMLLPWFVRRAYYFLKKPQYATYTSIVYAVLLLGFSYLFKSNITQKPVSIYVIMAAASCLAGFPFFVVIKKKESGSPVNIRKVVTENWHYGKWIILTGFLVSIANQTQVLVIGSLKGLEEAGIIRALQNFIQPMIVIVSAISMLVLPLFSSEFAKPEKVNLKRNGGQITLVVFIITTVYGFFLWIFRFQLEMLFYNGKYISYVDLIPLFGLIPIIMALSFGASVVLRAIQKPQSLFFVSIGWFLTSVITSFVFIDLWGISGALWSSIAGQTVSTIIFIIILNKRLKNEQNI